MNTYRNEDDSRRRDPRGRDGKYRFSPEQRYQEREREEDTLPLTVADVRRAMRAEQEERRQASRYQMCIRDRHDSGVSQGDAGHVRFLSCDVPVISGEENLLPWNGTWCWSYFGSA